jgi:hypothetical protein
MADRRRRSEAAVPSPNDTFTGIDRAGYSSAQALKQGTVIPVVNYLDLVETPLRAVLLGGFILLVRAESLNLNKN